uniref:preprotein translocase subunit SecA n=1 Tax=Madagascaria erythrocladioides TaxID=753684 RepID=UPI001BEDFDAE|nr:preprotein translocase subunit SecA [Madagascaria erythrocladioides]QUE29097.1 SecA [Madagascaria erythrocladioides]UNJ16653.1 preprotein translocase subunit SecA [Madagascaria erythrocladioides]
MLNTLFKNNNQRKLEKIFPLIQKINTYQLQFQELSPKSLQEKHVELKDKVAKGEKLENLLVEAYALIKEVAYRILDLNIYDVQLVAGIILHEGKIAEMRTGEGKTLAAALPAYLNSLNEEGVHIITVNDYLASRDAAYIGQIYNFLGVSVGLIQEEMSLQERQDNYKKDITYVTNSEVAFDYLRDNMALTKDNLVHKNFHYAIVDEVDSIFIDEARTPLIIGGKAEANTDKYLRTTEICKQLNIDIDYEVDNKKRTIVLTEQGISKTEQYLDIQNIYDLKEPWAPYLINSLKAKELYKLGIHYLIIDQEIVIVDEFTGRVTQGRRWSEGLHQAIEAKENLEIQKEMKTLASITYQNFFLLYSKLSGMTGTAKTEEYEFEKIYNIEVIAVPTNKKMIREDFPDLLYKNQYSKWKAVVLECQNMLEKGRPTLIGTTSISNSQLVSYLLNECGIPHNVLNAKPQNAVREAEIIAQAGRKKAITIATNMAGRGTDIILGGNCSQLTKTEILRLLKEIQIDEKSEINKALDNHLEYFNELNSDERENLYKLLTKCIPHKKEILANSYFIDEALQNTQNAVEQTQLQMDTKELYSFIYKKYQPILLEEKKEIIESGGLHIIGTERHDSRRIDNQLRGRAGRQGDPGSSRFFLSLEDRLLKNFGGNRIANIMNTLQLEEDIPIESKLLTGFLETAQQKVESYYYDIRKHVFDYDQVLSDHRKAIYAERKRILETDSLRNHILGYAQITINDLLSKYETIHENNQTEDSTEMLNTICKLLNIKSDFNLKDINQLSSKELQSLFQEQIYISYDLKEAFLEAIQPGLTRQLEKYILLTQIDECWTEHLQRMNSLQEIISWRSYGQNDPLVEYKREAFVLFCKLLQTIFHSVVYMIMRIEELQ